MDKAEILELLNNKEEKLTSDVDRALFDIKVALSDIDNKANLYSHFPKEFLIDFIEFYFEYKEYVYLNNISVNKKLENLFQYLIKFIKEG